MEIDGVAGVAFAVFAPNAQRVSVVGDFNFWDGRRHAMRVRGNGFWEIFVPGARAGDKYKYEIVSEHGELLPLKSDPVGFAAEMRPLTASIVVDMANVPHPAPPPPQAPMRSTRRSRSTRSTSARGGAGRRSRTAGSPIASSPRRCPPMCATSASPMSSSCR